MTDQQEETRATIVRAIPLEDVSLAEGGDGRTLEARIIPYDRPTVVRDRLPDGTLSEPYEETWVSGVFAKQAAANAAHRVLLNFEHERGIGGVIGRASALREETDGLYGTFRVLGTQDGDKALELVNAGILTGLSVEADPVRSIHGPGLVKRVVARLVNVALTRMPAFAEAEVLAVREGHESEESEPLFPPGTGIAVTTTSNGANATVTVTGAETTERELVADIRAELEQPDDSAEEEVSEVDQLLERIGYEPLLMRAVTKKPWDGSPARFTDEQYQRSCLIDRGGDAPVKERCSLPVLEPNGDLNANALGAAAGRISAVMGVSSQQKAAAARKLIRYYGQAGMDPPPALRALANS